ncbi:MAG: hypothetical protein M3332_16280 [Actinomycetota bacterium]|nr:hypothetical protein [Actinomycetota bacterium]
MYSEQESPISITLEVPSVLSYAMAHNEMSVITRLAIDGVVADVQGARLRLEVADATGSIGEAHELLVDLQAGCTAVLTDVRLIIDPGEMLQVEEQRPGASARDHQRDGGLSTSGRGHAGRRAASRGARHFRRSTPHRGHHRTT